MSIADLGEGWGLWPLPLCNLKEYKTVNKISLSCICVSFVDRPLVTGHLSI